MWGVVQPGAPILGRVGGWKVQQTPKVGQSWDILPTMTAFPPARTGCPAPCLTSINLDTSKTGQGIFFGTVGNTITIQRAGGPRRLELGRLNDGLRNEHGARRGSAWVSNGRWQSYPAMSDQAPYTKKGASGGHVPNDALARVPGAPPPITITQPAAEKQPEPREEYVYMGTERKVPRQVPKVDENGKTVRDDNGNIVYVNATDRNGNIIYDVARDKNGDIIYDNDRWEVRLIHPPKLPTAPTTGNNQIQVAPSQFSFEAYPSFLLVQNEVITRVYPAVASATAAGAKRIRMFGGDQGALWSTDGRPAISDVRYTGGDTTLWWGAKGWWQGEIQPVLGAVGTEPRGGGESQNVITLVDAVKFMPVKFGGDDILADFYLPSGEMAIRGSGDNRDNVVLYWDSVYKDGFRQATPPPVVAIANPKPSPADNVIFYFNRSVNPAHAYKVIGGGPGSTVSGRNNVFGAIAKAGQAEVEAKLRQGGGQDRHRMGERSTTQSYQGMWNKQHWWKQTHWRERFDWFEGGAIVAINAATGEILQSLPARDWNKVTDAAGRVQVAGNWVNVVGYAGMESAAARSLVKTGTGWRTQKHPLTISFGDGPDFLAGPENWRLDENRKPVFSAMREIDFDGTGVKMWEWLGSTEGILVWNPKGNKLLQPTGKDFFGHDTWGKAWDDGSAAFRTLDKDGNGAVEGEELASVWVWLDANSDAKVQEGELITLAEAGIDSITIPSEKDDKGGVVAVKGAKGLRGQFDVRDWWSTGGIGTQVYKQVIEALREQPSIYQWKPTQGGEGSKGGLLRYMTAAPGRITAISVSLGDEQEALEKNEAVMGLAFAVNPGPEGGFGSVVNFGEFFLASAWGYDDGNPRVLKGESVTLNNAGQFIDSEQSMKWEAKHLAGPTLEDVADIARIPK